MGILYIYPFGLSVYVEGNSLKVRRYLYGVYVLFRDLFKPYALPYAGKGRIPHTAGLFGLLSGGIIGIEGVFAFYSELVDSFEDGFRNVVSGVTTLGEVLRVTEDSE